MFRKLSPIKQEEMHRALWGKGRLKVEPWLEQRVLREAIQMWPRSQIVDCIARSDGTVGAILDNDKALIVDQLIAATGYKVDIAKVPFLAAGNLLKKLATRNGYPQLDERSQNQYSRTLHNERASDAGFWTILGLHDRSVRLSADHWRAVLAKSEVNGARPQLVYHQTSQP